MLFNTTVATRSRVRASTVNGSVTLKKRE